MLELPVLGAPWDRELSARPMSLSGISQEDTAARKLRRKDEVAPGVASAACSSLGAIRE